MDASEVAVSLALIRLHDLLSKSKDFIISQKLTKQISGSINNLRTILKPAKLSDDHNQETRHVEKKLRLWAHGVDEIAEDLIKTFRDQMSKSPKGRFATLVPFFSVMNGVCARKNVVEDFKMEVGLLFSEFTSSRPLGKGLPDNERASSSSSSKRNRENMRQRVESDIVGRDQYVEDLLARLIYEDDSNLRVIAVVGEHACGKTVLVRSVFSKLKIKHHFDCRAWVHVPDLGAESDRMKNLLVDILKQTPLRDQAKDLEHKQEEQLFEMLHKLLMSLRYLIVVDDLSEVSLINKLLVPFVDSSTGSRVIVTTTNEEMQKFADPWMPDLRLPDLTGTECKKLLLRITGGGNSIDDLESKILSKCNGPPPAISLLGGLLSAAEVSNCETLLNQLGDCPTLDKIMSSSFNELPYMMKPCVLYMALFPKESEVLTRRLFRQWAAEGLLAEAADGSVQMRSAEDCFHELESRNLIHVARRKLDGSARSCRLPAFLHKFFRQKAQEFGLLHFLPSADSVSNKTSEGMDMVTGKSAQNQQMQVQNTASGLYGDKVQCLQSITSFNTRKLGTQAREIEALLKSPILDRPLVLLRVLDLEGVYKPVLPKTFGNQLSNLRYLGLRWTVLDSIPESVGNLLLLETLDLKHTNITTVTSAIWNAKNLQHLYLSEASFDKSIPHHILSGKSLDNKLETLWGLSIETADSPMISVLAKLQSLKKLGATCHPGAVKAVTEKVSELTRLESLRLRSRDLYGQPASLDLSDMTRLVSLSNLYLLGSLKPEENLLSVLPGNLKALTLSMSKLNVDPMRQVKNLEELVVLRLLARSFTGRKMFCGKGAFPKLQVLKLWMLKELKDLFVEEGGMPNLEELEIRDCQYLRNVNGLEHIKSLKSVSLTGASVRPVRVPKGTLVKPKELHELDSDWY